MNKLYTQSEVERAIIEFIKNEYTLSHPNLDKVISTLTPIQLPTDEEIEKIAKQKHIGLSRDVANYRGCFVQGAEWMRDKIKGGSHE